MIAPRVLVAGLRGGSGKTIISLGIVGAWRRQGHTVAPFKKGPDYIDAAWLTSAAAVPCRNLDLFMHTPDTIINSFTGSSTSADVSVIEGNRGLFDGMDTAGTCSTAELAKLLHVPVILSVDCTKVTRTVAAMILGCQRLDPEVALRGVVLNRIAGPRHRKVIEETIGEVCGLPVVGAVPRLPEESFPERHLGLVPPPEHRGGEVSIEKAIEMAEEYLDLDAIWTLAHDAPPLVSCHATTVAFERRRIPTGCVPPPRLVHRSAIALVFGRRCIPACCVTRRHNSHRYCSSSRLAGRTPRRPRYFTAITERHTCHRYASSPRLAGLARRHSRCRRLSPDMTLENIGADPAAEVDTGEPVTAVTRIGVFRDAAFQFYYPENLEALQRMGAELVEISPMTDKEVPEVDALYLGGGFPETLAPALAENGSFKRSLHQKVESGLPVYAECGGAVYLGRTLHYEGAAYPMAGILPVDFTFSTRPRGHGYVELETVSENPFFTVGETLRGHEFHYTGVEGSSYNGLSFAFRVLRGYGYDGERDGLCYRNVLASYTHLHALGSTTWAPALAGAANRHRSVRMNRTETTTGKG